jgi:micrococcal nuclease
VPRRRLLLLAITFVALTAPASKPSGEAMITGSVRVIDGDTLVVGDHRLRLEGLHAPELDEPLGPEARDLVVALTVRDAVRCVATGRRSYDRWVARCFLASDGRDLAAAVVAAGLGRDCPRFSGGRYRVLEPIRAAGMRLPGYCEPR